MTKQEINEKVRDFMSELRTEIDIVGLINDWDYIRSFEDLEADLDSQNAFDGEIIYHSNAIEYLSENDPSLRESLELAEELGYDLKNLNSEILASLLKGQNLRADFEKLRDEVEEFFDELEDEEDENEMDEWEDNE